MTAPGKGLAGILAELEAGDTPPPSHFTPYEVALERDNGTEVLVEYFPDMGACKDHWVGVRRRTPLDASGRPIAAKASYDIGNSTPRYEQGLQAFAAKQYQQAFELLSPTVTWTPQMREAVMRRLTAAHADAKFLDSLPRIRLKPDATVVLRAEPHPDGKEIAVLSGADAPDVRRVSTANPGDGYLRIGTSGQWDLVAVVDAKGKVQNLGFILRSPGSQGLVPIERRRGPRLAMYGRERVQPHVD